MKCCKAFMVSHNAKIIDKGKFRCRLILDRSPQNRSPETYNFEGLYCRFSACYQDENTTVRFRDIYSYKLFLFIQDAMQMIYSLAYNRMGSNYNNIANPLN